MHGKNTAQCPGTHCTVHMGALVHLAEYGWMKFQRDYLLPLLVWEHLQINSPGRLTTASSIAKHHPL